MGLIAMRIRPQWADLLAPAAVLLGWQWLIFASLQVFRWSMRRANVSTGHVLRCVIYSYDLLFWAGLLVVAGLASVSVSEALFPSGTLPWGAMIPSATTLRTMQVAGIVCVSGVVIGHLLALWRLYRAYSLYMRFDRVAAMLLFVVVISLLTTAWLLVWSRAPIMRWVVDSTIHWHIF